MFHLRSSILTRQNVGADVTTSVCTTANLIKLGSANVNLTQTNWESCPGDLSSEIYTNDTDQSDPTFQPIGSRAQVTFRRKSTQMTPTYQIPPFIEYTNVLQQCFFLILSSKSVCLFYSKTLDKKTKSYLVISCAQDRYVWSDFWRKHEKQWPTPGHKKKTKLHT